MEDNQERRLWWIILGAAMTGSAAGKKAFEGMSEVEAPSTEVSLIRLAMRKEDKAEAMKALGVHGTGSVLDAIVDTLKGKVAARRQRLAQSQMEHAARIMPPVEFIKWLREKADELERIGK